MEALREYKRCFCTPEAIHASCEDYRAAASIDLEMDEADEKAGRKIEAPVLALWGAKGAIGKLWNVLEVWRQHANAPVEGQVLESGHYLAEEQPEEVLRESTLLPRLRRTNELAANRRISEDLHSDL